MLEGSCSLTLVPALILTKKCIFYFPTALKASFKAALEAVRCMTLPYQSYVHIQANCLLLKQVRFCLGLVHLIFCSYDA